MKLKTPLYIRFKILFFLQKGPKPTSELSFKIGCSYEEVKEQLDYLEKLGKIEKIRSEKFNQDIWIVKEKSYSKT